MLPEETDRLRRLEEKIAYLERHVVEQDRAMLGMAERIDLLELRVKQASERARLATEGGGDLPIDERPPHY